MAYIIILYLYIDILRKFDTMVESIIPQLPTSFEDVTDPDGKSALIWILGEYGEVQACMYCKFTTCSCVCFTIECLIVILSFSLLSLSPLTPLRLSLPLSLPTPPLSPTYVHSLLCFAFCADLIIYCVPVL